MQPLLIPQNVCVMGSLDSSVRYRDWLKWIAFSSVMVFMTVQTYLTECFCTLLAGNCALAFVFEGEMFEWRASELAVSSSQSWSDNESMTIAILLIHCASIYIKVGGILCKIHATMLFPYQKDIWGCALCHSDIFEWSLYFTIDCSVSWEQFSLGSFCGSI